MKFLLIAFKFVEFRRAKLFGLGLSLEGHGLGLGLGLEGLGLGLGLEGPGLGLGLEGLASSRPGPRRQ